MHRYACTHHRTHPYLYLHTHTLGHTSLALAGPSDIRTGWGIDQCRFEAEKLPTLAGPRSGGRAAFMTPMYPLYSTRP